MYRVCVRTYLEIVEIQMHIVAVRYDNNKPFVEYAKTSYCACAHYTYLHNHIFNKLVNKKSPEDAFPKQKLPSKHEKESRSKFNRSRPAYLEIDLIYVLLR